MSKLRSEQLIGYATAEFVAGHIEADELEDRIHRALTGEATDEEWIRASRHHTWTKNHAAGFKNPAWYLAEMDQSLKVHYIGPISA